MNTTKRKTETYVLTEIDRLDPVTVYVSNYGRGQGKIVIECYGKAWACFWGAMGDRTLQEFFVESNNAYILGKMLEDTTQTDFDEIWEESRKHGFDICAGNDVELAMRANEMHECFGPDWFMDLPTCPTQEYNYLSRIVTAVKKAFAGEQEEAA